MDLAERIAGAARPGEQVEAYVSRERETDVRVYRGEIETLSTAESAGVGVRVVIDGRQGFAYVGDLDEARAREALDEARDNASFATPDEHVGLASPDGHAVAPLELWDAALSDVSTSEKVELAMALERLVREGDG